ncbi:transient receptor potential cation channel protein painless-like [Anabrus simplex]|uniref:transient receptor potential cation channel protein painless-like n=1 Tax=Anabrus simplex TaxID=316456 RepID=UPI0035A39CEE
MSDSEEDISATSTQSQQDLDPQIVRKNLQEKWLKALDEGDLTTFEDMLLNNKVDPRYRYHKRGTCLEIACSRPNRGRFVRALLKKIKPTVNTIIPEPIHYAAREGADDAMAELLSHKQTDVNAVTSKGETPLHYLAKYYKPEERYRRCLQLLLNRPDIDINKANKNGYTIIHQAANNKKREMVEEILLNCRNELDLDSQYGHGRTARTFLSQMYPDLVPVFPSNKNKLSTAYSNQLLDAFNNHQIDIFRGLLHQVDEDGDAVFDANYRYGRPYNETCLEMACRQEACEDFIKILLDAGADPNQVNPNTNKTPIQVAAEALNYEALKILLENQSTNANAVDNRGWTALHYAAASPAIRALKVQSSSNSQDQRSKEEEEKCQKMANFKKCTGLIHKYMGIPVNMEDLIDVTNSRGFREIEEILKGLTEIRKIDIHNELREYLRNKQADDFITKFHDCLKNDSKKLDPHKHIFLQIAIENHLTEAVSKLLENDTDPNKVPDKGTPPLIMAVKQEDIEIMELLLSVPGIDVDIADRKGDTALHHAVRMQNLDSITALLNHGANIAHENVLGRTPLPVSSLQTLLDKSLKTNDKYFPGHEYYEVIFDYTLLTASKTEYEGSAYSVAYKSPAGLSGHGSVAINVNVNQQQNQTVPLVKKFPSPVGLKAETEILHYISKHYQQYKNLLSHPVISSFLSFKWNCVRHFFYLNILFYVLFFITLNSYIIYSSTPIVGPEINNSQPMNCYFTDPSDNETRRFSVRKCYHLENNQNLTESSNQANTFNCSEVMNNCLGDASADFVDVTQITVNCAEACVYLMFILAVFTGILAVRECFQIVTCGWSYWKNIENYLDIGIVSITITIMSLPNNDPCMESCRVFAILLSSCELILLLGREPLFSRNIEMLKTVTVSYIGLFLTFLAIILAFAHCLHIVFRQDMKKEGVYSGLWTICRTIVFMTGEYEADSLNFSSMPITSIAVFLLFVFFISIVLLNLLIGLSVNNTKMIEERSEVVCITSRIDLIYDIENIMLRFHNFFKCLNILTESVILFPKADEDKVVIALQNMDGKLKHNPIDNSDLRKNIYSLISAFRAFFRNTCCLKSRKCRKCRDGGNPKIEKNILEDALKIISSNSQAKISSNEEKKKEMKQKLQDILNSLD